MNTRLIDMPLLEKKYFDTSSTLMTVIEGLGFGILSLAIYAIPMAIAYMIFNLVAN